MANTSEFLNRTTRPELVFGIIGPVGADLDAIISYVTKSLDEVNYESHTIHLTGLMNQLLGIETEKFPTYDDRYHNLIKRADEFCEKEAKNKAALAGLGIAEIRRIRASASKPKITPVPPAFGHAYILRQLKRPQEVELLRNVYGRKFVLISVYLDKEERIKLIADKIVHFNSTPTTKEDAERRARELIEKDFDEKDNEYGQKVSDAFHEGDVFVVGKRGQQAKETVTRFIRAFFGDNGVSPTKDEYGLYAATAASLRSLDLSRQVGAAIFTQQGEMISQGCNEVPKPFGGTYWSDDSSPISRDYELGRDENHHHQLIVVNDLLERLSNEGFISRALSKQGDISQQVAHLMGIKNLRDAKVMDLIEFGRIIHAEMCAITDASRLGRPTKDTTLFCTTFPCHLCAKHIVAAGISRVVFLEPYPKSHAGGLHSDSITFSSSEKKSKVLFEPFLGISPRRYRDIFQKGKRKEGNGVARPWYEGEPAPMVADRSPAYLENEEPSIRFAVEALLNRARAKELLKAN